MQNPITQVIIGNFSIKAPVCIDTVGDGMALTPFSRGKDLHFLLKNLRFVEESSFVGLYETDLAVASLEHGWTL